MKHLITLLLALLLAAPAPAQDPKELYAEGKALYDKKDYKNALPKLQAAAKKGNKKAQYRLGRCYDKGHGVEEDNAMAFKYYLQSAKQDYAKAQYQVARCYLKGKGGVTADKNKARTWLQRAVKDPKNGQEVLDKMRQEAAEGDEDAKNLQTLLKK